MLSTVTLFFKSEWDRFNGIFLHVGKRANAALAIFDKQLYSSLMKQINVRGEIFDFRPGSVALRLQPITASADRRPQTADRRPQTADVVSNTEHTAGSTPTICKLSIARIHATIDLRYRFMAVIAQPIAAT
jgi:hypothetical protein